MRINQLSLSFSSEEIGLAIRTAVERAAQSNAQVPPELANLAIEIKDEHLIVSTKKKLGFLPVTVSAALALRPTADGEGVVVTLSRISAGFVGSEALAAQLLSQVGQALTGVPGCSVSGNDITLTKETLAARTPWLSVPGKISRFDIAGDTLEIAIG